MPSGVWPGVSITWQDNRADPHLFPITYGSCAKCGVRLFPEDDLRPGARGDLLVPADEVRVQVRLDHILASLSPCA